MPLQHTIDCQFCCTTFTWDLINNKCPHCGRKYAECVYCGRVIHKQKTASHAICVHCKKKHKDETLEERRAHKTQKNDFTCDVCGATMTHRDKRISCVECDCGHIRFIDGLNGELVYIEDRWLSRYRSEED